MNKIALALAVLAAVATAEMTENPTQTSGAEDNSRLGKNKAWKQTMLNNNMKKVLTNLSTQIPAKEYAKLHVAPVAVLHGISHECPMQI